MRAAWEPRRGSRKPRVALFFLACFVLSWACWIPLALQGGLGADLAGAHVLVAGATVPSLLGLLFHRLVARRRLHGMLRRVWDPRLLRARGLWSLFLIAPALGVMALLLDRLWGSPWPDPAAIASAAWAGGGLWGQLVILFLVGPVSEELGWRGYAMAALERRLGRLGAGLVLGALWSLWHLPLFFVAGTIQFTWGFATPRFWLWCGGTTLVSVLYTWQVHLHRGSILAAILLHFFSNAWTTLVPGSDRVYVLQVGCLLLTVAVIQKHAPLIS